MTDEVSLREYIEGLLSERDRRYEAQFAASDKAVSAALAAAKEAVAAALTASKEAVIKAEISTNERLKNTNEWRATLNDVTAKCIKWPEAVAVALVISAVISMVVGVVQFLLLHLRQ